MTPLERALGVLASLVREDGTPWIERADQRQIDDAARMLDPEGPQFAFITRPRGGSKSQDQAAVIVAAAVALLPPGSQVYMAAVDSQQASIVLDQLRGFVRRSPHVRGLFRFTQGRAAHENGTAIQVISADAASAYGLLPDWVAVDEGFQWPDTPRHREFWAALWSSVQKRPGCRLAILSSAGHPRHWMIPLWDRAGESPLWWRTQWEGPVPWQRPEVLEELRATLPDGQFRRLVLNQFVSGSDAPLATPEELDAIFRPDDRRPRRSGSFQYAAGLDLSTKSDATGFCVAHMETAAEGRQTVVVDLVRTWEPPAGGSISQDRLLADILDVAEDYPGLVVQMDPWQGAGLAERMRRHGLTVREYAYGAKSKSALGAVALTLTRQRRWSLPGDGRLRREFEDLQIQERPDGTWWVEAPRGRGTGHGDTAEAVLLASQYLVRSQPWMLRRHEYLDGRLTGRTIRDEGDPERFGGLGEREWSRRALDRMHNPHSRFLVRR